MTQPIEHLTAKQHEELKQELAELEARRPGIVQAIKVAREFGDLSENFEYHAAKNEQGLLEARIRTLRSRLDHAQIVDESELPAGEIGVGSKVVVEDDDGQTLEVEISSAGGAGAVSPDSPLGRALVGRREGESVEVQAPRGAWTARIVSVG